MSKKKKTAGAPRKYDFKMPVGNQRTIEVERYLINSVRAAAAAFASKQKPKQKFSVVFHEAGALVKRIK